MGELSKQLCGINYVAAAATNARVYGLMIIEA